MTKTYGLSETGRAKAVEQMMTDWPAVPTEDQLEQTLSYDRSISDAVAIPKGRQILDFPDPYGRTTALDLTSLMTPNVKFRKRRMELLVKALWTVKHSALFHEAMGKLFTSLDLNRTHAGPNTPADLLALDDDERRSIAIDQFMHSAAEFGENPSSIGISWTHPVPEAPGKQAHEFRMLPSNPAWMGFSGALPLVKDCYFLICPATHSHKMPGHAVGFPATPEALDSVKDCNSTNFPSPEARTLAQILAYHGAAGCYWRPQ